MKIHVVAPRRDISATGGRAEHTHPVRQRVRRFSAKQVSAITEAYEAGATMASLAKQHDVKRQSIAALLRRHVIAIRARKVISPEEIDHAVHLYGAGQSSAVIGNRLGFDAATIWRALKKRGVQMRSPNHR